MRCSLARLSLWWYCFWLGPFPSSPMIYLMLVFCQHRWKPAAVLQKQHIMRVCVRMCAFGCIICMQMCVNFSTSRQSSSKIVHKAIRIYIYDTGAQWPVSDEQFCGWELEYSFWEWLQFDGIYCGYSSCILYACVVASIYSSKQVWMLIIFHFHKHMYIYNGMIARPVQKYKII